MGYLFKEALKTLCGVNQWSYAVFWKIGCQNPKLLIWEECYYEPMPCSALPQICGIESPELAFDEWEACWDSVKGRTLQPRVQADNKVQALISNMMTSNQVNVVGEGLVGRTAFTGKHHWIFSENFAREAHPPEVLNELCQQFSAGMQTVAVIPILTHGVVQLGSSFTIPENMAFVNDVKTLILQLGCFPGGLLSEIHATNEPAPKRGVPVSLKVPLAADLSGNYKGTNSASIADTSDQQSISPYTAPVDQASGSLIRQIQDNLQIASSTYPTSNLGQSVVKSYNGMCQPKISPLRKQYMPSRNQLENGATAAEVIPSNPDLWLNQQVPLYIPRSGFEQQPCVGSSSANYSSLRSIEEQILLDAGLPGNTNNGLSASDGFRMAHLRTNGDVTDSCHKDFVSNPFHDGIQLQKGVSNHLQSISNQLSLPNAHISTTSSIFSGQPAGNGLENPGLSKRMVSTSDMADHLIIEHMLSGITNHGRHPLDHQSTKNELVKKENIDNDLFKTLRIPLNDMDQHMDLSEHNPGFLNDVRVQDYGNQSPRSRSVKCESAFVQPPSGDDLFDIFGVDFKNSLFNGSWDSSFRNETVFDGKSLGKNNSTCMSVQDTISNLYSDNEGNNASGIFSATGSDHLLDAVVSRGHSAAKDLDDDVSCKTTVTKISSSSVPNSSPSYGLVKVSDQIQGEMYGRPKTLVKPGDVGPCTFRSECSKEEAGNYSQTSSIYGSQISSWVEQGHSIKQSCSVSSGYSKKSDEISKSNRKRLKPGENPRPRPKDRQMIQDRVKELREIVPNGAKCSIDALLERTIKHMLFLQSVTKHADKLKQTGESKMVSKDGGLLLKDNFEGGATWAYEVGSHSMVCPIIVEDLNPPRQMLVEMLCEERGLFLEIADIIRGLGLTILKGVMETRNNKVWARFAVEANRDVTRMEIFLSLVRLLEQTIKSSTGSSVNDLDTESMMARQSFQQVPATGGRPPFNVQ